METGVTVQQVRKLRPQGSGACSGEVTNREDLWKTPGLCRATQSHALCEDLRAGLPMAPSGWRGEGEGTQRHRGRRCGRTSFKRERKSTLGAKKPGQGVGHNATNNSGHRKTAAKGRSCLPESRSSRYQFALLREQHHLWLSTQAGFEPCPSTPWLCGHRHAVHVPFALGPLPWSSHL